MIKYILKRVLVGFVSLFILITVTFFMMHAMPGSPFSPAEEKNVPPEVIARMEEKYGLNDPVPVQYVRYLKDLFHGDLGISFKMRDTTVNEVVERSFPTTAKLGLVALVTSLVIGISFGVGSAVYKNKFFDWFSRVFATIGISVPSFVVSLLLLYAFSVKLRWFSATGGLSDWKGYVLPVIALSLGPIAYITRLMRSSMLDALQQDYIRTARAKGVPESLVIFKHALRNSIIPIIAYFGTLTTGLLTGSFVVEQIFSINGIGKELVSAISNRDYAMIVGLTIFFGIILLICDIVADLVMVWVDPRTKIFG